jgi:hypothetical protein
VDPLSPAKKEHQTTCPRPTRSFLPSTSKSTPTESSIDANPAAQLSGSVKLSVDSAKHDLENAIGAERRPFVWVVGIPLVPAHRVNHVANAMRLFELVIQSVQVFPGSFVISYLKELDPDLVQWRSPFMKRLGGRYDNVLDIVVGIPVRDDNDVQGFDIVLLPPFMHFLIIIQVRLQYEI